MTTATTPKRKPGQKHSRSRATPSRPPQTTTETQPKVQPPKKGTTFKCKCLWIGYPDGLDRLDLPIALDSFPPVNTLRFWRNKPFLYLVPAPADPAETKKFCAASGKYRRGWRWEPIPTGFVLMPRAAEIFPSDGAQEKSNVADFLRRVGEGKGQVKPAEAPYEMGADARLEPYRKFLNRRKFFELTKRLKSNLIWLSVLMVIAIIFMVLIQRGGS